MPAVVGSLLRGHQATLAVAESCTGGLIAHLLTGVAGSSDYFLFSAVTYANQAKIDVLGVEKKTLRNHGAVHEETARQMAAGARRVANADYGLSTTGIAGPSGGTPQKPVGTVCIGLADRQGSAAQRFHLNFDNRRMNKRIFAFAALEQLRQALLEE
jgi:nicotinamide-nucleotide amidase